MNLLIEEATRLGLICKTEKNKFTTWENAISLSHGSKSTQVHA